MDLDDDGTQTDVSRCEVRCLLVPSPTQQTAQGSYSEVYLPINSWQVNRQQAPHDFYLDDLDHDLFRLDSPLRDLSNLPPGL